MLRHVSGMNIYVHTAGSAGVGGQTVICEQRVPMPPYGSTRIWHAGKQAWPHTLLCVVTEYNRHPVSPCGSMGIVHAWKHVYPY